jgi:hypothetical protein
MKIPSNCILFSAGGRDYSLDDLVAAAKLWGDWDDFEKEVRLGIACLKWAEEEGDQIDM